MTINRYDYSLRSLFIEIHVPSQEYLINCKLTCYSIFSFMCMFYRSSCVLFSLAIVLSVFLRFKDSDYPLGIFKIFFEKTEQQSKWRQ